MSVQAAGDMFFGVEGAIRLLVKISGHKTKTVFEAAPKLASKIILGMAFIDMEIDGIEKIMWQIIPWSRHAGAIVASPDDEDAVQLADGITTGLICITKLDTTVCRVAKARMAPPTREASVLVCTREAGTYIVKPTPLENDKNRLSAEKRIMKIFPYQLFSIMIANTSKVLVHLSNNMKVATLGVNLSKNVSVQKEVPVDPINAVPI